MRWLLVSLLLVSFQSFAANYSWQVSGYGYGTGPTPHSALEATFPSMTAWVNPNIGWCNRQTDTHFLCRVYYRDGNINVSVYRSGDSCPNPTDTYNPETGGCDAPEQSMCEANSGQVFPFQRSGTAPDSFMYISPDGKHSAADQVACMNGCQVSTVGARCVTKSDGSYTCKGEAISLASECVTTGGTDSQDADPVLSEAPDPIPPEPKTEKIKEPCVYVARADGSLACRSVEVIDMEGMSCGTGPDGQTVCSRSDPNRKGTIVDTTITTTDNPDGSSTTVKTDKTTYVTCVGTNCTTQESTTTTTTGKDGNGNTHSSSTTCTGPNCLGNNDSGEAECLINCGDSEGAEYDGSAEWSDAEAGALGSSTGGTIAEALNSAVDGALEGREEEIGEALGEVPNMVEDMFGDLAGLSFMDSLFVPAAGCSELVIPFELGQYSVGMAVDFCVLSKYKTLLEWVIWCLTAIAVWNVYYSGLRLQNASASRGGF